MIDHVPSAAGGPTSVDAAAVGAIEGAPLGILSRSLSGEAGLFAETDRSGETRALVSRAGSTGRGGAASGLLSGSADSSTAFLVGSSALCGSRCRKSKDLPNVRLVRSLALTI